MQTTSKRAVVSKKRGDDLMNGFHRLIVAYFLMLLMQGCGFQGDPYYGDPSTATRFNDLSVLENKIE